MSLEKLRYTLLNFLVPVLQKAGEWHLPFVRRDIKGYHVYSVVPYLKPGAVFVSAKGGEFTNLLIPGDYKHAAMYCHDEIVDINGVGFKVPFVVEAVGKGVIKTDLITFMTGKDRIKLLYPKFATDEQMLSASLLAASQIGKPYDYYFDPGVAAFYCAELIQFAYEQTCGNVFTKRTRLGVETVYPQDFVDATNLWSSPWNSKDSKETKDKFHAAQFSVA